MEMEMDAPKATTLAPSPPAAALGPKQLVTTYGE
jgi:hypothetical protein